MKYLNKIIDKTIELIFTKDNKLKLLMAIVALGFILRIISAVNQGVLADDMHYAPHAINIINSGILGTVDQPPFWYYMTDAGYHLFGVGQLTSRLAAVIFGTLTILLVFLITKEFLSRNIALLASFLIAISPLHIRISMPEMDVLMTFLILFSAYLFILFHKSENKLLLILSMVFFGIAMLTKYISATFIPFYVIYFCYKRRNNLFSDKNIKYALTAIVVVLITILPTLTYNYLLYKDKGLTDAQFAKFLKIESAMKVYEGISGFEKFSLSMFIDRGLPIGIHTYFFADMFNFIFALIGIVLMIRKRETRELAFILLLLFAFTFAFVADVAILQKHYVFACPIFAIFAAYSMSEIYKRYLKRKEFIYLGIALLVIWSLILLGLNFSIQGNFYSKSPVQQMFEIKKDISENALVVADSRIYRGEIAWMFNDRHYIEAGMFQDLINAQENLPGTVVPIKTYYIECASDDCGWGNIKDQPDFNQSMEAITSAFVNRSEKIATAYQTDSDKKYYFPFSNIQKKPHYIVYETVLELKSTSLQAVDSTHSWFYHPLRYTDMSSFIFHYNLNSEADKLLNWAAYMILLAEVVFVLLSVSIIIYKL